MSHRSGHTFRKASARDLGVLALGLVLVITGVGLFTCASPDHRLGTESVVRGGWSPISSATTSPVAATPAGGLP